VSVRTVRYYEERGLLSPALRTSAGVRVYGLSDVARLQFIRRLRSLGLSLAEIENLLGRVEDSEGARERVACTLDVLLLERERVDEQLAELNDLRHQVDEALESVRVCMNCRAEACPPTCSRRAYLL